MPKNVGRIDRIIRFVIAAGLVVFGLLLPRKMPVAVAALLIAAIPVLATEIPPGERRSGFSFMTPETQAIQTDDTANPGMLWVLDGEALWKNKANAAGKACADCHDAARASMKGVAARYPAFDKALGRPVDLEQRINLCRANRQQATPFAYESRELLALTAFVAQQSRDMPIVAGDDPQLAPFIANGRELFTQRQGQLNLGCANCHTIIGTSTSPAPPSRKDIRPAIQSTGWSGSHSARCNAGCAAASPAFAPRLMITARRSWSNSSFI